VLLFYASTLLTFWRVFLREEVSSRDDRRMGILQLLGREVYGPVSRAMALGFGRRAILSREER
jgi:hypothetical protein